MGLVIGPMAELRSQMLDYVEVLTLYSQDACRRSRHKITNLGIRRDGWKNEGHLKDLNVPEDHQGTLFCHE